MIEIIIKNKTLDTELKVLKIYIYANDGAKFTQDTIVR